jgi:hypothetical protein
VKRVILFLLTLCLILPMSGCNLPRTVRDHEIREFNQGLKSEFDEITKIKTHISRPVLHWDIHVNDLFREDEVFRAVAAYLKESNVFESRLRKEYTGIYSVWSIDITLIDGQNRKTYEGHYYQKGTTIYPDDKNNTINNFSDWYIFENGKETGVSVHTG